MLGGGGERSPGLSLLLIFIASVSQATPVEGCVVNSFIALVRQTKVDITALSGNFVH